MLKKGCEMTEEKSQNDSRFLLGNEAIARSALEAGIHFAAGYPGTPSSEIIQAIVRHAEAANVHVEWSVNEKVGCEGAAAFRKPKHSCDGPLNYQLNMTPKAHWKAFHRIAYFVRMAWTFTTTALSPY